MPHNRRLLLLISIASLLATSFAVAAQRAVMPGTVDRTSRDSGTVSANNSAAQPGLADLDGSVTERTLPESQTDRTTAVDRGSLTGQAAAAVEQNTGSVPEGIQRAGLTMDRAVEPDPRDALSSSPGAEREPAATAERLPIIEYHYSTFYFDGVEMRPEWFVEQMEWLAENGYHTVTVDELAEFVDGTSAPPLHSVALTFDVGISHFDDYREVVIPTLRRLGLHGIFFIQPQGVTQECDGEFTCWPTLAAWQQEGIISIGSHTISHRDFATLSPAQIYFELARSQEILERELGVKPVAVCYPFDSVNPAAFPILERLGYRFAVAGYVRADRSTHLGDPERYSLPRVYPYSSGSIYPAIVGAGGMTFPELVEASTGG